MNHESALANAIELADRVLTPSARRNDKEAGFSSESITALGSAGLLGMMLPAEMSGAALGPRTFAAVVATLAEADASVAMVYLMHVCATATIAAAREGAAVAPTLKEIAAGRHLSTLAFSEAGSRSHFWAPVSRARRNGAGVHITAKKSFVTSAGQAHSYVVSALAPEGAGPTDSTLYLILKGARGLSASCLRRCGKYLFPENHPRLTKCRPDCKRRRGAAEQGMSLCAFVWCRNDSVL